MKATEDIQIEFFNKIGRRLREFDEKHGWIDYFIAPVIVTIILLTVYAIKGVYPFGMNTVAYYDMPSTNVPSYTYIWDVLHGRSSIFLNWMIALGAANSTGMNIWILPLNYMLFLTSREGILYFTSFMLLIRFFLCAFSISLYLKKHSCSTVYIVCAGILYAYCGYNIQYYNNLSFLDYAFILPLLVYAFEKLMYEYKYTLFMILCFFLFIKNPQFSFMISLYLVYKGYFILNDLPENAKGKSLRLFACSVIVALFFSGCVLAPEITQLLQSSRVKEEGGEFNYFDIIKTIYIQFKRQKRFIMYGSEIAVGLCVLISLRGKEMLKKYRNELFLIAILALPILHEGINLLWHAGSYKHFPIRFGFIITFECLCLVGKYLSNEENNISYKYHVGRIAKLMGYATMPFVAYVLYDFFLQFEKEGVASLNAYLSYRLYFVTLSIVYLIVLLIDSVPAKKGALIILSIIQAVFGCYGFIAPKEANADNYRIQYVLNSIELGRTFEGNKNYFDRIKANPAEYESNYAMVTGQPAISSWSYGVTQNLEQELRGKMGYDGMNSYIMDSGGTVFTDALLGIKYVVSSKTQDKILYIKDSNKKSVYNSRYTFPFGFVIKEEIESESKYFDYHNELFSSITKLPNNLIDVTDASIYVKNKHKLNEEEKRNIKKMFDDYALKGGELEKENESSSSENDTEGKIKNEDSVGNNRFSAKINVTGTKALYIVTADETEEQFSFVLNGSPLYFDSFITRGNYYYPINIREGIVFLGAYTNEEIALDIYTDSESVSNIEVGQLDIELLNEGIDIVNKRQNLFIECSKRDLHVSGVVNQSGVMFFPIAYSDNWHAKMNGKEVEIKPFINGSFIGVDVEEGDVDIKFTYLPKGLMGGILLSVMGIVFGVSFYIFEKHGGLTGRKCEHIFDKLFIYGYYTVVAVLFVVMYVIPIWIKMAM